MSNTVTHSMSDVQQELLHEDNAFIFDSCNQIFESLKNASIFITGGTGFIGIWLLEALRHANIHGNFNVQVTVLTRDLEKFRTKSLRRVEDYGVQFVEGDVVDFDFPEGTFTHVIHAATDASAYLNENHPDVMYQTITQGTARALEFAVEKNVSKFLFLSSGAIYGQQPWEMTHISEDWYGSLDCLNPRNTYAEAKRSAELLCAIYTKKYGLNFTSARIFSTFGPFLPLDTHFAIGNFIKSAIDDLPLTINGNGMPHRSGLYISETVVWLFHVLLFGNCSEAYNIGSDESLSIEEIALKVSKVLDAGGVHVLGREDSGWNLGRYVPSVNKFQSQFNLKQIISFEDAITRTALWNGWKRKPR